LFNHKFQESREWRWNAVPTDAATGSDGTPYHHTAWLAMYSSMSEEMSRKSVVEVSGIISEPTHSSTCQ
jgi:hypothetical protein